MLTVPTRQGKETLLMIFLWKMYFFFAHHTTKSVISAQKRQRLQQCHRSQLNGSTSIRLSEKIMISFPLLPFVVLYFSENSFWR